MKYGASLPKSGLAFFLRRNEKIIYFLGKILPSDNAGRGGAHMG